MWCSRAVDKAQLYLWPSTPVASSHVPKYPGLVQWLALADSKHCVPLVESCLSQLLPSDSNNTIRRALTSPHLRKIMDGLHSETKTGIMCKMAGLPLGFQVNIYTTLEVLVGFEWRPWEIVRVRARVFRDGVYEKLICPPPPPGEE